MSRPPDENDYFSTDHLSSDLRGRSVRGGAVMLVSQTASFVIGMGSVAVLARLLTPADFGLIAMVTAITGFVALFKDAGLSMATVQRQRITHQQVSTLFWINVLLSLIMLVVVAALAPLIAWFYREPRLIWVTLALSATFIFGGLSVQHQALLRRQMRFGALAAIGVAAMIGGTAITIIAALAGLGYWALILQVAAVAALTAAGVWITCRWRPGRPVRGSGVRPMLAFGGHLTGSSFLGYLSRNADDILIGRYWGPGPLGFYSKAYQILLLPILQISVPMSSVALPALSRLQNEPERFRSFYLEAIGLMVFIGMPVVAFLFVEAHPVVLLVLGGKWLASVPIFQALAVAAFLGTFNISASWVYTALGHTRRQLQWSLFSVPITLGGFLIGLPWGPVGVAASFSITRCLLFPPATLYCYRGTFLRFGDLIAKLSRPAAISIAAAAVVFALNRLAWVAAQPLWAQLVVGAAVYALAYILGWMTTQRTRREFLATLHLVKVLAPSASATKEPLPPLAQGTSPADGIAPQPADADA